MARVSRRGTMVAMAAVWLLAAPAPAGAHGGAPLRLGIQQGPQLGIFAQVIMTYMAEGSGLTVNPVFFEEAEALEKSFGRDKLGLGLAFPPEARGGGSCSDDPSSAAAVSEKIETYYRTRFPGAWIGWTNVVGEAPCQRAVILVGRRILEDLRFSTLLRALERVVKVVGADDVELLRRQAGDDVRKRRDAARDLLIRKDLL